MHLLRLIVLMFTCSCSSLLEINRYCGGNCHPCSNKQPLCILPPSESKSRSLAPNSSCPQNARSFVLLSISETMTPAKVPAICTSSVFLLLAITSFLIFGSLTLHRRRRTDSTAPGLSIERVGWAAGAGCYNHSHSGAQIDVNANDPSSDHYPGCYVVRSRRSENHPHM